jgi:FtsH-binding integral membrane protein
MASSLQGAFVVPRAPAAGRYRLLDKYFYFAMSLLFAAIVVAGFSRTVNQNLLHPAVPRPFLLWIHAAAFTLWIVFYILQSALVRVRKVKLHRLLGWFGAGLAAIMVPLGFTIAIIMGRFDKHVIHIADANTFLSVPFGDMLIFSVFVGLAIYWRKKPELHRRLLFVGTCGLLDAAFGRFDYLFSHSLFFLAVDAVILLGVARDLLVNRRVHIVYRVALPSLVIVQALMVYLWRGAPAWWSNIGQALLG